MGTVLEEQSARYLAILQDVSVVRFLTQVLHQSRFRIIDKNRRSGRIRCCCSADHSRSTVRRSRRSPCATYAVFRNLESSHDSHRQHPSSSSYVGLPSNQ